MSERAELLERLETELHRPVPEWKPPPPAEGNRDVQKLVALIRKAVRDER